MDDGVLRALLRGRFRVQAVGRHGDYAAHADVEAFRLQPFHPFGIRLELYCFCHVVSPWLHASGNLPVLTVKLLSAYTVGPFWQTTL